MNKKGMDETIRRGTLKHTDVTVQKTDGGFEINGSRDQPADVLLIHYDSREQVRSVILTFTNKESNFQQCVKIKFGELGGHTVPHYNVVTAIQNLGIWYGGLQRYSLEASSFSADHSKRAILVQVRNCGPIIGALRL